MRILLISLLLFSANLTLNAQTRSQSTQPYHAHSQTRLSKESKDLKSALRNTPGVPAGKNAMYDRVVDQYIQSMSEAKSKQDEKDAFILMLKRFDFPIAVNQAFMKNFISESFSTPGR